MPSMNRRRFACQLAFAWVAIAISVCPARAALLTATNQASGVIQVLDIKNSAGVVVTPTDLTLSGVPFLNVSDQSATGGGIVTNTPTFTVPSTLVAGSMISLGSNMSGSTPTTPSDAFAFNQLAALINYVNNSTTQDYTVDLRFTYSYTLTTTPFTPPTQEGDSSLRIVANSATATLLDTGIIFAPLAGGTLSSNGPIAIDFSSVATRGTSGTIASLGLGSDIDIDVVPEPSTLALSTIGATVLGVWVSMGRAKRGVPGATPEP